MAALTKVMEGAAAANAVAVAQAAVAAGGRGGAGGETRGRKRPRAVEDDDGREGVLPLGALSEDELEGGEVVE